LSREGKDVGRKRMVGRHEVEVPLAKDERVREVGEGENGFASGSGFLPARAILSEGKDALCI
jgi:hypothetical protein